MGRCCPLEKRDAIVKAPRVSERRTPPKPGQESVWDYPLRPTVECSGRSLAGEVLGAVLFNAKGCRRVIERGFAPVYYVAFADVRMELLTDSGRRRHCEHRGTLAYWSLQSSSHTLHNIAWSCAVPKEGFEELVEHMAFFPSALGACWLDGERVREVAGDQSGGWITSHVAGPFEQGPSPSLGFMESDGSRLR